MMGPLGADTLLDDQNPQFCYYKLSTKKGSHCNNY